MEIKLERRKNLYCGPEHVFIPTLTKLASLVEEISKACDAVHINNYQDKKKLIRVLADNAKLEVDKLILKDIQLVEEDR